MNIFYQKHKIIIIILGLAILPSIVSASVMSSESYRIGANTIGPGALETQSSASYTIRYPWQNTTTSSSEDTQTTGTETTVGAGVIPGSISSDGAGITPNHINAFNVSLVITEKQSGTLKYDFPDNLALSIEVPKQITPKGVTITTSAERESIANEHLIPSESDLIGNIFWNITAVDSDGATVRQFDKYITITLQIPDFLIGARNLGVYFFDDNTNKWILVPNSVFAKNTATFRVNHLTKFAIFGIKEILDEFDIPIYQKLPEILGVTSTSEQTGIISPREIDIIKPEGPGRIEQLFDINLELEDTSITKASELVARVVFVSFGTVPTPVDMTFDIFDKDGYIVYSAKGKITVETEAVFTKKFKDINLASGKYTVVLTTLYSTDIQDEFRQDFEIVKEKTNIFKSIWVWVWIIIIVGSYLIFKKKKRKK